MYRSNHRSKQQFVFTLVLFVFAAALSSVFAGCGYSYSKLTSGSKLMVNVILKDFPCQLQLSASVDVELPISDQVICEDKVYLVGTASDPDVLNMIQMLKNLGRTNLPAYVSGRAATEVVRLREGPIKVAVLEIAAMEVNFQASFGEFGGETRP